MLSTYFSERSLTHFLQSKFFPSNTLSMDGLEGIRFQPTNEEIILFLKKMTLDPAFIHHSIEKINNIYEYEPWELPGKSKIQAKEQDRYFFCKRYYKYAKGEQSPRRTNEGSWKITGRRSSIKSEKSGELIGSREILTFYRHCPRSKKEKTEWVMHEFHLKEMDEFVLCRVKRKREKKKQGKKHALSTNDEVQSSQHSVSSSGIHVTENISSETVPPPSPQLLSNGNHPVTEILNTWLLPSDHLISYSGNHAAEIALQQLSNHNLVSGIRNQLPPNHNLISCFKSHILETTSPETELPPNQNLISCFRNHVANDTFWDSQLVSSECLISQSRNHFTKYASSDPQLLSDGSLISCPGNQTLNSASPKSQLQPNNNLISYTRNHFTKDTSFDSQLLPTGHLIPFSTNQVSENTFPKSQLLHDHELISYPRNEVTELTHPESLLPNYNWIPCCGSQTVENNFPMVESRQLSYDDHMISNIRNHVVESTYSRVESQQLSSHTAFDLRNHVAIINAQGAESQQLPSYYLISDFRDQAAEDIFFGVDPLLLAQFDTHHGYNQLDYNSFFALQLATNTEHQVLSDRNWFDQNYFSALLSPTTLEQRSVSCSDAFSNDCYGLDFQFDSKQGDVNLQWPVQDNYPLE